MRPHRYIFDMTRTHAATAMRTVSLALLGLFVAASEAKPVDPADGDKEVLTTTIVYLGKDYDEPPPLSLVDKHVTDKGIQGARIALGEDNRTGRLIGQDYKLLEAVVPKGGDVVAKAKALLAAGHRLFVADLEAPDLLSVADLPEARDAIFFDVRTSDDSLRQEKCRANIFHIPPSWAMRADALAQYLAWKKWRRWRK